MISRQEIDVSLTDHDDVGLSNRYLAVGLMRRSGTGAREVVVHPDADSSHDRSPRQAVALPYGRISLMTLRKCRWMRSGQRCFCRRCRAIWQARNDLALVLLPPRSVLLTTAALQRRRQAARSAGVFGFGISSTAGIMAVCAYTWLSQR